jgi:hypothetical protein
MVIVCLVDLLLMLWVTFPQLCDRYSYIFNVCIYRFFNESWYMVWQNRTIYSTCIPNLMFLVKWQNKFAFSMHCTLITSSDPSTKRERTKTTTQKLPLPTELVGTIRTCLLTLLILRCQQLTHYIFRLGLYFHETAKALHSVPFYFLRSAAVTLIDSIMYKPKTKSLQVYN